MAQRELPSASMIPSNSKAAPSTKIDERRLQKVTSGRVIKKKKGFFGRFKEDFVIEDRNNIGDYIVHDVLIPAIKGFLYDAVLGGLDMGLYGGLRGNRSNHSRGGFTNRTPYGRVVGGFVNNATRGVDRNSDRRDSDEILLESRGEAEEVLSEMIQQISDYGKVSVADFYDLLGEKSQYTDLKYGWTDLRSAKVDRVREGYFINLPRAKALD